jgi:hypothetical protein
MEINIRASNGQSNCAGNNRSIYDDNLAVWEIYPVIRPSTGNSKLAESFLDFGYVFAGAGGVGGFGTACVAARFTMTRAAK